jgi:hypothetical protein
MATKEENMQKDTWWLNELESLGVSPKVKNELNNIYQDMISRSPSQPLHFSKVWQFLNIPVSHNKLLE